MASRYAIRDPRLASRPLLHHPVDAAMLEVDHAAAILKGGQVVSDHEMVSLFPSAAVDVMDFFRAWYLRIDLATRGGEGVRPAKEADVSC